MTVQLQPVQLQHAVAVHVFIGDYTAAAHWWARMTGVGVVRRFPFCAVVTLPGVELVFCYTDPRNPIGGSPVPYFEVADFNASRAGLRAWGCVEMHYPLKILSGEQISQFRDPFGTIFGIQGPAPDGGFWPEAQAEAEIVRGKR